MGKAKKVVIQDVTHELGDIVYAVQIDNKMKFSIFKMKIQKIVITRDGPNYNERKYDYIFKDESDLLQFLKVNLCILTYDDL